MGTYPYLYLTPGITLRTDSKRHNDWESLLREEELVEVAQPTEDEPVEEEPVEGVPVEEVPAEEALGQVGVLVSDSNADGKILVFVVRILEADGGLAGWQVYRSAFWSCRGWQCWSGLDVRSICRGVCWCCNNCRLQHQLCSRHDQSLYPSFTQLRGYPF
jgi:hypothetical protein